MSVNQIENVEERVQRIFELRELNFVKDQEGTIEGYAAVFDKWTNVGGYFEERIMKGAFTKVSLEDVVFLVNHDMTKIPLARSRNNNKNSTLYLEADEKGLKFKAVLDIEGNSEARNLYSALKRGDIDGMSFGFLISKVRWDDVASDLPKRSIVEFSKVFEISAVNLPQYKDTEIYARQNSESLESDKKALENVRSQLLDNNKNFELEKQKALFFMQKKN